MSELKNETTIPPADVTIDSMGIAMVCHEVNRAYCEALGDTSQVPWQEAPEWQRKSAVAGVHFHATHPKAGPEASHENWSKGKRETGWTWGSEKCERRLLHPCMVPFSELPQEQQAKDHIFRAVVRTMLALS